MPSPLWESDTHPSYCRTSIPSCWTVSPTCCIFSICDRHSFPSNLLRLSLTRSLPRHVTSLLSGSIGSPSPQECQDAHRTHASLQYNVLVPTQSLSPMIIWRATNDPRVECLNFTPGRFCARTRVHRQWRSECSGQAHRVQHDDIDGTSPDLLSISVRARWHFYNGSPIVVSPRCCSVYARLRRHLSTTQMPPRLSTLRHLRQHPPPRTTHR